MNEPYKSFNDALDELQIQALKRLAWVEMYAQNKFKDDPVSMEAYRKACKRLETWLDENPMKVPPNPEYFLK